MAVLYVDSTAGSGTSPFDTWAKAATTLAAAFNDAAAVAGSTIYVGHNHAESSAANQDMVSAGTKASPIQVICGNTGAEPPTAVATTAVVGTTGANRIRFDGTTSDEGYTYYYGISFRTSTSGGANVASIEFHGNDYGLVFEDCDFKLLSTSTSFISFMTSASSGFQDAFVHWINCTVEISASAQSFSYRHVRHHWDGGSLTGSSASLFNLQTGNPVQVYVRGVDISSNTGDIVQVNNNPPPHTVIFDNCKIGGSATLYDAILARRAPGGPVVEFRNTDTGDTNYRHEYYAYPGDLTTETTIVRTSGASDGTTAISWQIDTLSESDWTFPFYTPWVTGWIDSTGSKTWTAQIVHDSVTNLQNDEVWLEVEYLGTSGFPLSIIGDDRAADILATPADQSTTGDTWTTTGLTNPNTQDCSVTATVNEIGPWRARLGVNKASYTLYFCPLVEIT